MSKISFRQTIVFLVLIGLFLLIAYCSPRDLLYRSNKTAQIDSLRIDLPLSRCTVAFDPKVLESAVNASTWAELDNTTLKAKDNPQAFIARINQDGLAEALANSYDGFVWDAGKPSFKMPKDDGYVLVPTWILYQFVDGHENR